MSQKIQTDLQNIERKIKNVYGLKNIYAASQNTDDLINLNKDKNVLIQMIIEFIKQMELKPYSAETKDNFWISIGYHICKLRVDFDRIYTNIGEYNFYETGRIRQLIFYYIQPDRILSRLITHLSRVMHSLDYNNGLTSHIESGDISIPIQSIFFKAAPIFNL